MLAEDQLPFKFLIFLIQHILFQKPWNNNLSIVIVDGLVKKSNFCVVLHFAIIQRTKSTPHDYKLHALNLNFYKTV